MRIILLLFISLIIFNSCKERPEKKIEADDINLVESDREDLLQGEKGYLKMERQERSLPTERALAQSKLDRFYASKPEAMQMLTSMIYEIDFIIKVNQEPQKNLKGYHLDFRDDFTYEKFEKGKLAEKGKYFYGMESDLLIMLPDDENLYPSEWTLKSSGIAMVFAGTSTFSNNNTQMHMVGKDR